MHPQLQACSNLHERGTRSFPQENGRRQCSGLRAVESTALLLPCLRQTEFCRQRQGYSALHSEDNGSNPNLLIPLFFRLINKICEKSNNPAR